MDAFRITLTTLPKFFLLLDISVLMEQSIKIKFCFESIECGTRTCLIDYWKNVYLPDSEAHSIKLQILENIR